MNNKKDQTKKVVKDTLSKYQIKRFTKKPLSTAKGPAVSKPAHGEKDLK